ncbi:class I SAM-dependent methyltransferase [Myceligenerans xiligouense]|uniref:Methyltransferase family protein n=1 Tax=Myceligenerans xiligouense TaxID=253184 RepID=A0A3N4Z380_9MICO|nr:class I SAM-dependent methyltransferase [Myceligenerans xiligouense]RPF19562.1 methyltransferase family protein [Myceligenerans xiligouense]
MSTPPDVRIVDATDPESAGRSFLPGMGKNWLTPFFDVAVGLLGMRRRYARTVDLAGIRDDESVLDVGCGTGGLLLAVLDAAPGARVTGLDPDRQALDLAARKLRRARRQGTLVRGFADRLPADDGTVDHVVSSMALHHVPDDERPAFAREVARVLRPGGRVTILDMGGGEAGPEAPTHGNGAGPGEHGHGHEAHAHGDHAHGTVRGSRGHEGHGHGHGGWFAHLWKQLVAPMRRRGETSPVVAANLGDGIPRLLAGAGLENAREVAHEDWSMGRLTYVQATAR